MADPVIPATPQQFSFGGNILHGIVTGFDGFTDYRSASHKFLKRDGGREEDMGRDQRRIDVRLVFIGANCARNAQNFASFVDSHRTALLVHPIYGKWIAFCKGFGNRVNFAEATNKIDVPVAFIESDLDASINPSDTPDAATAAQNCTAQQSTFKQTVATFVGELAKLQTQSTAALNSLDSALAQVAIVTAPVDFMRTQVNLALGAASSIIGVVANIQAAADAFDLSITGLVAGANDLFNGVADSSASGATQSVATLVGVSQQLASTLEDALFAAPSTPAGCANAIADVEIMVDACMTLSDAVAASLPPTTVVVVPVQTSLLVFAQHLIDDWSLPYDALTYASAIIGLNRIATPAAMPAGTNLIVPTA